MLKPEFMRQNTFSVRGDTVVMKIIQAGPLTTIQDAGRFGYMEYGIGQSGVMDHFSYRQANQLVGNTENEAVLEMTLVGAEILFDEEVLAAYTGADMQAKIGGEKMERGRVYQIKKGQIIKFGFAKTGVRSYLAISGEIKVPVVMNSKSTDMKCGIGGFFGRKLQNRDELQVQVRKDSERRINQLMKQKIKQMDYVGVREIRVVLGPQANIFTAKGVQTFLTSEYIVSSESDRMGMRMEGPQIEGRDKTDIISDGIVFGSIQITSAGQPIVMMADHQTTGGYAKIATVIKDDLPKLAQAGPGDHVRFKKIEINSLEQNRLFRALGKR
jgi:biotin-dependent carboxylase-like uncharacterized protein